jgi:hypothetical protein
MIGPVSGTGRTMMASLQQAMEKGMPPDQAIQYVKSMATQGVAPLADLYSMMNQFQRLKQQQVKPPQTPPTIRDQLNMMDQQQQMPGQMPQQGNIQQMQAPAPAGQPMDRGLGAIDAGLMEYPQFNGGGIVAMASGALADSEEPGFFERSGLPFLTTERGVAANREALANFFTPRKAGISVIREAQKLAKEGKVNEALELLRSENIDPSQAFGEELPASSRAATETAPAPPQAAPPSPVSTAANPFAGTGGVGFDINLGGARADTFGRPIAQDQAIVPAPARDVAPAPTGGRTAPATTGLRRMTEEKPKETSSYLQELKDLRESEGLGKARAERMAYLTNEEKNLAKEFGSDKMLAFAEAGFRMAGAASRPGATFLGALSEGAMSGTQALRALNKEYRLNKRTINDAMYQMREADEAEKEGDIKTALNMRENAKTRLLEAEKFNMNLENDIMVMNMRLSGAERVATIQSGGRGGSTAGFRQTQLQLKALQDAKSQADRVYLSTKLTDPKTAADARQQSEQLQQQINSLVGLSGMSGMAMESASAIPDDVLQALSKYR